MHISPLWFWGYCIDMVSMEVKKFFKSIWYLWGFKKEIKLKLSWSCYLIRVCCITRWKKIQYYCKGIIRFYIRPKSQNYLYFEISRSWFGPALLIIKGKAQMWIYMTRMGKRHDWTTPWSNGPGNASTSLSPIKCIQNAHCLYNHAMDCPTTAPL